MGDNPFDFFKKPTLPEMVKREKEEAAYNLKRYGRADYINEKEEQAWSLLYDNDHLPVGPERSAIVDQWHGLMTAGRKLSNIEAARHQQQGARSGSRTENVRYAMGVSEHEIDAIIRSEQDYDREQASKMAKYRADYWSSMAKHKAASMNPTQKTARAQDQQQDQDQSQ